MSPARLTTYRERQEAPQIRLEQTANGNFRFVGTGVQKELVTLLSSDQPRPGSLWEINGASCTLTSLGSIDYAAVDGMELDIFKNNYPVISMGFTPPGSGVISTMRLESSTNLGSPIQVLPGEPLSAKWRSTNTFTIHADVAVSIRLFGNQR